jgi:hypothetical protein
VVVEMPVEDRIGSVEVKGFIDLLDTEGRIIDLKVVKRSPSEEKVSPDHRFQVATYRRLLGDRVGGAARVDHLVKNKVAKIVYKEYMIQPCDLEETEKMYPLVQQAIRTGLFLPNRSSYMCSRKYCSFWRACAAAGLTDLDWVKPALAALERGESLPFTDLGEAFRLLGADPTCVVRPSRPTTAGTGTFLSNTWPCRHCGVGRGRRPAADRAGVPVPRDGHGRDRLPTPPVRGARRIPRVGGT